MRSLTHLLRSSSLNEQTLTVPSAIVNYFPSSVFPERRPRKQKHKHFLCCGRFQFLLVAFRNTTTYREGETKTDHIDDEARLFWRNIVKTKHQSLISLACMRLVQGADRAPTQPLAAQQRSSRELEALEGKVQQLFCYF